MRLFNKVIIIGTGLIGGSVGLAIKSKHLAHTVIGINRHRRTNELAKQKGAIDEGKTRIDKRTMEDADLVILATPVSSIIKIGQRVASIIDKETVVIDVGSSKEAVVNSLSKVIVNFIGTHPLAGSEKQGITYACAGLLNNSLCILTPIKTSSKKSLKLIHCFWKALGAKTICLTPKEHDKILSLVSHLPHVLSFCLMHCISPGYFKFSSSGLRDITRLASSSPLIWRDIFLSNKKNTLKSLSKFRENLNKIEKTLADNDAKCLLSLLQKAARKREKLQIQKK